MRGLWNAVQVGLLVGPQPIGYGRPLTQTVGVEACPNSARDGRSRRRRPNIPTSKARGGPLPWPPQAAGRDVERPGAEAQRIRKLGKDIGKLSLPRPSRNADFGERDGPEGACYESPHRHPKTRGEANARSHPPSLPSPSPRRRTAPRRARNLPARACGRSSTCWRRMGGFKLIGRCSSSRRGRGETNVTKRIEYIKSDVER